MYYAIIAACTIQSQCLVFSDNNHNPHETLNQCEAHLAEMMTDIPEIMGQVFGPIRFSARTSCMNEMEYEGLTADLKALEQQNGL